MAATGLTVVTRYFEETTAQIEKTVRKNTQVFGETIASAFQTSARQDAPWTDRKGSARRGLFGSVTVKDGRIMVEMGGKAENYKKKSKYDDYMELLEFGHKSKKRNFPNLAIVYPTYMAIKDDFAEQYGAAIFKGGRFAIRRSGSAARARAAVQRARNRSGNK